ncbi:glycosyltransferase [Flavobacterium sp. RS13.1]|uniref:glycosyltransferase n=1 Tax=Flavobacterium sp. RS13.1 TaxID=3400345 RepID=UPI003AAB94BC
MISIVVSSYRSNFFEQFCCSVEDTIGVEYEIIKIDNPNLMGICEAYNLGASKANFTIILFSHEDVIFKSLNWGKEIKNIFNSDEKIGLIGLAGCKVKSCVPSGWYTERDKFLAYNFIQSNFKDPNLKSININITCTTEVATIDGFFMVTKKEIVSKILFNESLLKGYHGYDLDISLAVGQNYKVVVSHLIKVEHLSLGTPDINWFQDILKVNENYNEILPIYTNNIKKSKTIEYDNLKFLLSYKKSNQIEFPNTLSLICKYYKNVGFFNFIKINLYIIYLNFR